MVLSIGPSGTDPSAMMEKWAVFARRLPTRKRLLMNVLFLIKGIG
jgi:hypothetical protein